MPKLIAFLAELPTLVKAGGSVWVQLKGLTLKGKIAVLVASPFVLGVMMWLADKYGKENVNTAIDALLALMGAL